jgi:LPXTG-motif cell wall-anchored protein
VLTRTTITGTTAHATPAAYRVLRPGTGSGLLWMALAAIVVVALGSAGGLALRRRR